MLWFFRLVMIRLEKKNSLFTWTFTRIPLPKQLKENLQVPPLPFWIWLLTLDSENIKIRTYDDHIIEKQNVILSLTLSLSYFHYLGWLFKSPDEHTAPTMTWQVSVHFCFVLLRDITWLVATLFIPWFNDNYRLYYYKKSNTGWC